MGTNGYKLAADESFISRNVPTIVKRKIQVRAQATLAENKRYPNRENDRKYLLRGLIRYGTCGRPRCGRPAVTKEKGGKRYFYYICTATRPEFAAKTPPHSTPRVSAPWLEELVWQDIKQFIENPGETLERVQSDTADETSELQARHTDLTNTPEAFHKRQQLVRMLVEGVTLNRG